MLDPVTSFQHRPLRTLSSVFHEALQTLFELLILSLLLLGIIGLMFKAFGAGGLVPRLLHSAWQTGPGTLVAAVVALILAVAWVKRAFYKRPAAVGRSGDMLVFSCLALGTFFALRLAVTGGL